MVMISKKCQTGSGPATAAYKSTNRLIALSNRKALFLIVSSHQQPLVNPSPETLSP